MEDLKAHRDDGEGGKCPSHARHGSCLWLVFQVLGLFGQSNTSQHRRFNGRWVTTPCQRRSFFDSCGCVTMSFPSYLFIFACLSFIHSAFEVPTFEPENVFERLNECMHVQIKRRSLSSLYSL